MRKQGNVLNAKRKIAILESRPNGCYPDKAARYRFYPDPDKHCYAKTNKRKIPVQRHASSNFLAILFAISVAVCSSCKESNKTLGEIENVTPQPDHKTMSEKNISVDKCTARISNGLLYLGIDTQPIVRLKNGLVQKDDLREKNGLQIIEFTNRLNEQCSTKKPKKLRLILNDDIPYITLLQVLWTGYISSYAVSTKVYYGRKTIELAIAYQCVLKSEKVITFMLEDDDYHYKVGSSMLSISEKETPVYGRLKNQLELDSLLATAVHQFPDVKAAILGGVDLTPAEEILNTGEKIMKIYSQSSPLCLTRGVH